MLKPNNGPHPLISGETGQEFPTQDITDLEVIEQVNCLPEDYQPLPPEDPHPDNARLGLNLILVAQRKSTRLTDPQKMERVYMTLPGAWTTDTRLDPDGVVVTIKTRKALNRLIVTAESVSGGIWTKTINGQGGDAIVGDEVQETRAIPGNPVASQKPDPDGTLVTIVKTLKESSTIVAGEPAISGAIWAETIKEPVTQLVAYQVVKSRTLPGGTMIVSKLEHDGASTTITRTLKDKTTITPGETFAAGVWTRITQEDPPVFRGFELRGGSHVAWEIVDTRSIPGNALASTVINKDGDIITETKTLSEAAAISTTTTIISGVQTHTTKEPFPGSALIAWKVVQVRSTAFALPFYSVEIPDVIPQKVRASLPLVTTETTVKGTASQPSLAPGDFYRSQQQLDEFTYRLKVVNLSLSALPLSYIDHGITEKFGGGPTTTTWKLQADTSPDTIDEGLLVIDSTVVLLGNGTHLKKTDLRDGSAWPTLDAKHYDDEFNILVDTTKQVVAVGTVSAGIDPTTKIRTEFNDIDYQRTEKILRNPNAAALDAYFTEFDGQTSVDVPPELIAINSYFNSRLAAGSGGGSTNLINTNPAKQSFAIKGHSNSGAGVIPEVDPVIKHPWTNNIPCRHALLFMPVGFSLGAWNTAGSLLYKLQALLYAGTLGASHILPWPKFVPVSVGVVCKGQHVQVANEAEITGDYSARLKYDGTVVDFGKMTGNSDSGSVQLALDTKVVRIPPTIHAAIGITGSTTDTQTAGAGFTLTNPFDSSISINSATAVATGTVSLSIGATAGQATIPTSGLYLWRSYAELYRYGYLRVHCEIVDFANIV